MGGWNSCLLSRTNSTEGQFAEKRLFKYYVKCIDNYLKKRMKVFPPDVTFVCTEPVGDLTKSQLYQIELLLGRYLQQKYSKVVFSYNLWYSIDQCYGKEYHFNISWS